MSTSLKPRMLQPGDSIGIIAPASHFSKDDFLQGIAALTRAGFIPRYRDDIFARCAYHAGDIARRVDELHEYIHDDSITAIMCARGGFGSQKLLPHLNITTTQPKIFVGYSDITALHAHLATHHQWSTFYGPTICRHLNESAPTSNLENLLQAIGQPEPLGALPTSECQVINTGNSEGKLTGGCLSLIYSTLGTPYQIDTRDSIIFLEDRGEKIYALDRMLVSLTQAGLFDQARGVIFGSLELCDTEPHPEWLPDMLTAHFATFDGPVVTGLAAGHCDPCLTLPFGCQASLSTDPLQLSINEAAVLA